VDVFRGKRSTAPRRGRFAVRPDFVEQAFGFSAEVVDAGGEDAADRRLANFVERGGARGVASGVVVIAGVRVEAAEPPPGFWPVG
jgi:hypothetical protein